MVYLCYDTALNEEYTLVKLIQKYPGYISLFTGTDDQDIWDAAPYLFEVSDNFYQLRKDPFIQLDHCILFETHETKEEVCRFLHYYMYKKTGNKTVYVRIWDARVLIKHLPVWDEKERVSFFEFFKAVYTEQENGEWLDRWQLARFNKPAAVPVLKTEVLTTASLTDPDRKPATVAGENPELMPGPEAEAPSADSISQPPKRRRFFID
ncbi:DUF4123 domain-containing protein [Niabella yanshanensis]|uniref:DUF4123 domain-containing protein n=1 Tax=Niabella yanshanensis TaxID=577386 RepID=A0ABZ0WBV6_9BACT|nr:DUF4123 domain-containing protein [Niabella yanshanensis]WQD40032.1 DUF4123 domain-containing protein [Niabella yanshanensis]